ncbi:hypothetical protein HO133_008235 [Letharia lupina]|uniref:Uncharacterized protein n=1 Tax=Letharia lupina TaxID=560253 RepID=A0A8H6CRU6_9LECA|nr:uncharacterized protein HO133_008235 [Letharia lupina]KAF6228505.1 hypothetical protein HO133_008235 [Letharia lupina]
MEELRKIGTAAEEDGIKYRSGMELALVALAVQLSMVLVALDMSIIAIAIPRFLWPRLGPLVLLSATVFPIGGAVIVTLILLCQTPAHVKSVLATHSEPFSMPDTPGIITIGGAQLCYIPTSLPWSGEPASPSLGDAANVVDALVGSYKASLTVLFVASRGASDHRSETPSTKQRTGAARDASIFFTIARPYKLPSSFQTVNGVSPFESGMRTLGTVPSLSSPSKKWLILESLLLV